ncbi:MAG TPA: hypothetical protein VKD22_08225, partial [Ramlibacter sp.]|nr:hypothetical protein [Ramlibacter sp.]
MLMFDPVPEVVFWTSGRSHLVSACPTPGGGLRRCLTAAHGRSVPGMASRFDHLPFWVRSLA